MVDERFAIKRSPLWRPLLSLFSATAARSWVRLTDEGLEAKYGWYRLRIPWSSVESVERASWPWYGGIGWRSDLRRTIGLIGATSPVVRVRLSTPQRTRLLVIPHRLTDLYVSLEDPEAFIQAASSRIAAPRPGTA